MSYKARGTRDMSFHNDEPEFRKAAVLAPVLPLLSAYGGSLHAIEMRLREIKPFLPDAFEQSGDERIDAALKILADLLKE